MMSTASPMAAVSSRFRVTAPSPQCFPQRCPHSAARRTISQQRGWQQQQPSAPQATPGLRHRQRRRVAAAAAGGPSDAFVLDFDGVLVDSEVEVSTSAFEACKQHWPDLFGGADAATRQRVMAGLRATRPRLVKGWEAMAMARLVLEDDGNVQKVLADWDALLPATLAAWGDAEGAALAAAFEAHRSQQMRASPDSWLALNPLYEGVAHALTECPYPFYIASSKAAHRLVPLLRHALGMEVDEDSPRLYAGLIPPERKIDALRSVMARPVAQGGATLHFVDDRYETLHAIAEQAPDVLERYKIYLADWGYCTAEERAAAAALPGIRVISRVQFLELLKFGVIMGVDDGCEPTAEEVEAGVRG